MTIQHLNNLRHSPEAPFNHEEYTFWLHNTIVSRIQYEINLLKDSDKDHEILAYSRVLNLDSLKIVEYPSH